MTPRSRFAGPIASKARVAAFLPFFIAVGGASVVGQDPAPIGGPLARKAGEDLSSIARARTVESLESPIQLDPALTHQTTSSSTPGTGSLEDGSTLPGWAAAAAIFGSAAVMDQGYRDLALEVQSPFADQLSSAGRWMGDWKTAAPIAVASTFLVAFATAGTSGFADGVAVVAGTFGGSMSAELVNLAVGRSRPLENRGAYWFDPLEGKHASFPSGHTAFAFSLAGSVDAVTDGWAPAAIAYGAATLTGLSRVYDDKHWVSDVVAGAAIGTIVSRFVARRVSLALSGRPETPGVEPGNDFTLVATPGSIGARLTLH